MNDAQVYAMVVGALGLGAGAVKLGQMALRRDSHGAKSGQLSPEIWERKMAEIGAKNLDEKVMPILKELKEIAQKQNEIQQRQNEILVELVTASRIGRRQ